MGFDDTRGKIKGRVREYRTKQYIKILESRSKVPAICSSHLAFRDTAATRNFTPSREMQLSRKSSMRRSAERSISAERVCKDECR